MSVAPVKPSKDVSVTKTIKAPKSTPSEIVAGKYKIIEKLGEGGMGVVYKAKDSRLKSTVALKFLPAELTQKREAKDRFIQKAQAQTPLRSRTANSASSSPVGVPYSC